MKLFTSKALVILSIAAIGSAAHSQQAPQPAARPALSQKDVQPSPQLSPEEVVRTQIGALSADGEVRARIERCYHFASPANRLFTGPLDRFSTIVNSPPFAALLDAKQFLVGRAAIDQDEALLLLTVVDDKNELRLFRCFLSKQSTAPYKGCWMTDAVVPVGIANPPEQLRKSFPPSI